jgi:hypothetical protein
MEILIPRAPPAQMEPSTARYLLIKQNSRLFSVTAKERKMLSYLSNTPARALCAKVGTGFAQKQCDHLKILEHCAFQIKGKTLWGR